MAIPTLTLGSFNLTDWAGVAYRTAVMASGLSKGAPVPINTAVQSFLQDGSIVATQGYDNRDVLLRVQLRGTSLTAVAQAEAALFAEMGEPNLLTWTPASGPAAVFVVVTSSMEEAPGEEADLAEAQPFPWRYYNIRLTCEAFTRSAAETVTASLPATGTTTTLVNDGSATTNWTGLVDGISTSPSVVSGAVKVTGTSAGTTSAVSATLTTSITTSSTKYIQVDWKPESADGGPVLHAYGDGVELTQVAATVSPTAGFTRTWFGPVAASSIAVLKLEVQSLGGTAIFGGSNTRSIYVDNVNRTDVTPSSGSGRQLLRSLDVGGSARASGSISIEHASTSLGDVMAYFYPDVAGVRGYSPPLRQYRVSGGTVTGDSTLVSGAREDISTSGAGTAVVFDVPVVSLSPGMHQLVVRAKTNYTPQATFAWSAQLRINSTNVGAAISGTGRSAVATNAVQAIYAIGRMILPPTDTELVGTSAVVRITLAMTGDLLAVSQFDEAWLFNTDIGRLLGPVPCGTGAAASGGPANRLFTEPPTPKRPRHTVRIGFAANRSDSFYPSGIAGWQFPKFTPGRVNVLTVTTNAADASVTLRYTRAWHTNPAA